MGKKFRGPRRDGKNKENLENWVMKFLFFTSFETFSFLIKFMLGCQVLSELNSGIYFEIISATQE